MLSKIISNVINNLLGRGLAFLTEYLKKRKVRKLESQVASLQDKVLILKKEKLTQIKIENWRDRLRNKEQESLVKELNRIINE
jgi:RecB family exonuclease